MRQLFRYHRKEIKPAAGGEKSFDIWIYAGDAMEVEAIEEEASGGPSLGVGCGDMCRRGSRSRM